MLLRFCYCGGLCVGHYVVVVEPLAKGGMGNNFGVSDAKIGIRGIVSEPVLAGTALDLRNTLTAKTLIGEESRGGSFPVGTRQDRRERHSILNRLVGALTEVRQHRVCGIAEQSEPSAGPGGQWLAIIQSPSKRHLNVL